MRKVFLARQARIARVHVRVDEAGEDQTAAGVEYLVDAGPVDLTDLFDESVATHDVAAA